MPLFAYEETMYRIKTTNAVIRYFPFSADVSKRKDIDILIAQESIFSA